MPPGTAVFTAEADHVGERLDRYLTGQIPDFSRSQIQRLIEGGHVSHSRYKKVKPNSDIREGDVIGVDLPEVQASTALPEDLPIEILYNDYQWVAAFAVASLLSALALVTLVVKKVAEWAASSRQAKRDASARALAPVRGAVSLEGVVP